MQDFFNKLTAVPLRVKVGAVVGAIVLLCAGYWYFFYSDMMEEKRQLAEEAERLGKERKDYEKRKKELQQFLKERDDLLREQQDLLRVLPKEDEIEQFIEGVQGQIELTGLSKVASFREPPQPQDIYVRIPIRMSLIGTYHQINRFFRNVGELKRIVNIEDLTMVPFSEGSSQIVNPNAPQLLKASFVAATFRFVERRAQAAGPAKSGLNITSQPGGH